MFYRICHSSDSEVSDCDGKHSSKPDAFQYALRLVARAEQFRAGLSLKLQKKGYSKTDISKAAEKLSVMGMLDDSRYARLWLASRMKRGSASPRELLAVLCSKGISHATASAALKWLFSDSGEEPSNSEITLLRRYIAKKREGLSVVDLRKRLRFEGFSFEVLDCLVDE